MGAGRKKREEEKGKGDKETGTETRRSEEGVREVKWEQERRKGRIEKEMSTEMRGSHEQGRREGRKKWEQYVYT